MHTKTPHPKKNGKMTAPPSKSAAAKAPAPFASDDKLLAAAAKVFQARRKYVEAQQPMESSESSRKSMEKLQQSMRSWTKYWHQSFDLTSRSLPFTRICTQHRLGQLDREILAALLLNQLGMTGEGIQTCRELLSYLGIPHQQFIPAMRKLSEQGRLCLAKLLSYDDPESDLAKRTPIVDPTLLESVLSKGKNAESGWKLKSEQELFDHLGAFTQALMNKSDALHDSSRGFQDEQRIRKWSRQASRLFQRLEDTLPRHPDWKLANLRKEIPNPREFVIFLALLGKYLGHVNTEDLLFTGGGLARAVSDDASHIMIHLRLLGTGKTLVQKDFICPCGGDMELAASDACSLERMEFELTAKAIALLGIEKRTMQRGRGDYQAQKPTLRLDQMVLSDKVRQALNMALVHARCGKRLIDDWGLGEMIPYGRSPVLLFSGSPGTGKTATAQGIAHELNKPVLVADYSRIQNCFVGQTEKNIVRVFQEAKKQDAVLFWDEADAMFYDRDSSRYNWEVRDVNVLLQQLEHFEGVCILATNRKITLDKALERRISLKIEFERPCRKERRQIWEKFLPKKLPLARDVDFNQLSEADLAGGEIKNVVLNAARLALQRDEQGPVTVKDFQAAIEMETKERWNADGRKLIGFGI